MAFGIDLVLGKSMSWYKAWLLLRVEGWPEGGEFPVEGGGGDEAGHRAAEGQPRQHARPQRRRAHHPRHAGVLPIHAPGRKKYFKHMKNIFIIRIGVVQF